MLTTHIPRERGPGAAGRGEGGSVPTEGAAEGAGVVLEGRGGLARTPRGPGPQWASTRLNQLWEEGLAGMAHNN